MRVAFHAREISAHLERMTARTPIVAVSALRAKLQPISKPMFDSAVLSLYQTGAIVLHRGDTLVTDNVQDNAGRLYNAISRS
jgi:hypothetical protein